MDVNSFSFTVGGQGGFDPMAPMNTSTKKPKEPPTMERSDNGAIWFMVFLPLLGLYFENYTESRWTGMLLWGLVILAEIGCAAIDLKRLGAQGYDCGGLRGWVWLTPVYVFRREQLLGRESYKAIMLGVFCLAALTMNGFVTARLVNTETVPDAIEGTMVSNLDNISGNPAGYIGEKLQEYLGEDRQWECTKEGHIFTAVCTGSHGGQEVAVVFEIEHDGYIFQGVKVTAARVAGEELDDEERRELLTEIFLDTPAEDAPEEESPEESEE